MKPKLNCRVRQTTQDKLKEEAEQEEKTLSSHVDDLLTKHVQKQEVSHSPKKETK